MRVFLAKTFILNYRLTLILRRYRGMTELFPQRKWQHRKVLPKGLASQLICNNRILWFTASPNQTQPLENIWELSVHGPGLNGLVAIVAE